MTLPTNIDATYADSGTDASVALHQQHHDAVHAAINGFVEAAQDAVAAMLAAGAGISLSYDDSGNTFTVASTLADVGGWVTETAAWTRTGATTFTQPVDSTGYLQPGTRVRWKESAGAYKYGVVAAASLSSGTTTVTLIGNDDYSMGATPDSGSMAFSRAASPAGFPGFFNYTPTITGYSSNPVNVRYTWRVLGRMLFVSIAELGNGTSNATTKTYSLPSGATAATLSNANWLVLAQVVNSGTASAGQLQISSGGAVINVFATGAGGAFTASGSARVTAGEIWCDLPNPP